MQGLSETVAQMFFSVKSDRYHMVVGLPFVDIKISSVGYGHLVSKQKYDLSVVSTKFN